MLVLLLTPRFATKIFQAWGFTRKLFILQQMSWWRWTSLSYMSKFQEMTVWRQYWLFTNVCGGKTEMKNLRSVSHISFPPEVTLLKKKWNIQVERAIVLVECTLPQVHLHNCDKPCYISHLSDMQMQSLYSCRFYFSVSEGWLWTAQWGDVCHVHFQGCGILPAGDHRGPCK